MNAAIALIILLTRVFATYYEVVKRMTKNVNDFQKEDNESNESDYTYCYTCGKPVRWDDVESSYILCKWCRYKWKNEKNVVRKMSKKMDILDGNIEEFDYYCANCERGLSWWEVKAVSDGLDFCSKECYQEYLGEKYENT